MPSNAPDSTRASAPSPETAEKEKRPRTWGARLREYGTIIAVALLLSFLFKTFIMRAFYIPSGSMENTLQVGDRVFVNKMIQKKDVKRGEIVVFHDDANWQPVSGPENPLRKGLEFIGVLPADSSHYLVKRVIGLPGDHVKSTADGKISVNGKTIDEPYLYPGNRGTDIPFDVTVPEGKLWVLGDHRSNSADSRYHMNEPSGGFIPRDSVEGTGWFIAFPFDRAGGLSGGDKAFEGVPSPSTQK